MVPCGRARQQCAGSLHGKNGEAHKKEEQVWGKIHIITNSNNDWNTFILQQSLEQR